MNFISSMKSLYLSQPTQKHNYNPEKSSFLFYNVKDNSIHLSPYFKGSYDLIGKYSLSMLSKELDDSQRVYYYKLLIKYFENCIQSKVPIDFFEQYINQICKE